MVRIRGRDHHKAAHHGLSGAVGDHDIGRPLALADQDEVPRVKYGGVRDGRIAYDHVAGRPGKADTGGLIEGHGQHLSDRRQRPEGEEADGQG